MGVYKLGDKVFTNLFPQIIDAGTFHRIIFVECDNNQTRKTQISKQGGGNSTKYSKQQIFCQYKAKCAFKNSKANAIYD